LVLRRDATTVIVRSIAIAEHFHVYVDSEGDLRTDHALRLGRIPAVRLHHRMARI
jgi:hypothetical protein